MRSLTDIIAFQEFSWSVIGLFAAGVVQTLLIVWLLVLHARRKKIEGERQTFAELAHTKEHNLNEVVSNVPGIVWESRFEPGTRNRRTTFMSQFVEKMLGYTPDEWLGSPGFGLRIMPEPEDRERVQRESDAVIESG